MFDSEIIEEFIKKITKLPNISKKTAEKIVYWIFEQDYQTVGLLANSFKIIKEKIILCEFCFRPKEEAECIICNDPNRENTLLVIENLQILDKIEKGEFYKGKYFVFNKKLNTQNEINENSDLIAKLINHSKNFNEVILGISPNLEGEIVSTVLKGFLESNNINVTQIAIGIPIGASVDYIDQGTLNFSLKNRK
ncbi:recombination protein RecR [Mycoplasma sp. CSL7491-lung]|uniref:recombination protein RecR n=1 Tax=Mycoplasma sp. CSL7491-lung TaxID=549718 RepID=UPI001C10F0FD|nr:recombination protein RecR [Mycoplasma sp. CSL7491-lung]MBU4693138.1 recombination protein RecR [Mycoplasma sp. CSL7491-lung]